MCVALPLKVNEVDGNWAIVEVSGGKIRVRSDLVSVKPGDYVLVHAGFIIEKLEPEEARKTLDMFREIEG
ncbi:MAG TPA: HypC/HybG/HupF family hydrogenase formation chaperone [Firmicutes bacterium]|nr:HypC/HybG/HupF family hydrogenase formation chaperone [Candidatus Fermentithermobacillaceae bacterium]